MKASEFRRRYQAGERDFQGINFKGENLSGLDFSNADIRGSKFCDAKLKGAKFCGATCGLKERGAILLIIFSLYLAAISGIGFLASYICILLISQSNQNHQIAGLAIFILLFCLLIIIVPREIKALTAKVFALSVVIATILLTIKARILSEIVSGEYLILAIGVSGIVSGAAIGAAILEAKALVLSVVAKGTEASFVTITTSLFGVVAVAKILVPAVLEQPEGGKVLAVLVLGLIAGIGGGIYIGWRALQGDKKYAWMLSSAIFDASLAGTSFRGADLTEADLTEATLKNTNFTKAILTGVNWHNAIMLEQALVEGTYLQDSHVRQLLIEKGKSNNSLRRDNNFDRKDLRGLNLQGANLTGASFIGADLSETNLRGADLFEANLVQTQLDRTDLREATLTGACIENSNMNNLTNLDDVICDYVWLKADKQERLPHDKSRKFKSGEFAKYMEKALNTVPLIFTDGIDWNVFLESFKKLQDEYGSDKLAIQSIEKKTGDAFVIRIEVSQDANKEEVESKAKQLYENQLKIVEDKYREELKALKALHKDEIIKLQKKYTTRIHELSNRTEAKYREKLKDLEIYYQGEIIKLQDKYSTRIYELSKLENRTIKVEATAVTENQSKNVEVEMNFQAPVTTATGKVQGNQIIYTSQSLSDASTEIQNRLTKLQDKGLTQEQAEGKVASDLATYAQNDPTALGNLVNWGKSLGNKAAETSVSEVVRRVIKLALNLAGFPIS